MRRKSKKEINRRANERRTCDAKLGQTRPRLNIILHDLWLCATDQSLWLCATAANGSVLVALPLISLGSCAGPHQTLPRDTSLQDPRSVISS
jgi:hypothetical protein